MTQGPHTRIQRKLVLTVGLLLLASCGKATESLPECAKRAYPEIGGPFSLIDHHRTAVTQASYANRDALVFFGFTYCPDVCPLTMYTLGEALGSLPDAQRPYTLFVSVDPERDTPQVLADYIASDGFPAPIAGLTGPLPAIADLAGAFAAGFSRIDTPDDRSHYSMEHSSIVYLMDRSWKLKTFFTFQDSAEQIAACIAALKS